MRTIQNYVRAKSLEEAYQLKQKRNCRVIGGMLWLNMGSGAINTAIDLCDLGLNTIEETDEQFSIGAMVTLRQLEQHESLNSYCDHAVEKAVRDIVGVQFRNMATVGGSIWGRYGFSDVLTVFLAMDTYVELYKGGIIPLAQFAAMNYDTDLLVRILVKKVPIKISYQAMRITRTDFPVLTCAVSEKNGTYSAVIGARPGRARIVSDEKGILSEQITLDTAETFAEYAAKHVPVGSNSRGSAAYRSKLVRTLCARGIMELGGQQ